MSTIKAGGVPEHFNLPWHLSLENKSFLQKNINLEWIDFPGGTGAMCQALRNEDIDIAIILTEGIIKDIIAGNPCKIVQTYIQSPLIWGIHVSANSKYNHISEIENTIAAISRYGSGSHLMSYINAQNQGWNTSSLQFEVVKNLDGAVTALTNGNSDYFMWEHFTTKPLVDNGTFKRIADCPTPWPCFVVAVRDNILSSQEEDVKTILDIINTITIDFKKIPNIDNVLAHRYEQQLDDIKEWLHITEWSQSLIREETLNTVQEKLYKLNLIDTIVDSKSLVHKI